MAFKFPKKPSIKPVSDGSPVGEPSFADLNSVKKKRNTKLIGGGVVVVGVIVLGVAGFYGVKQSKIRILQGYLAKSSVPLNLTYQKSGYNLFSGIIELRGVALTPVVAGGGDNRWTVETVRLEPLMGGLSRSGRIALVNNQIAPGFWPKAVPASANKEALARAQKLLANTSPMSGNLSLVYELNNDQLATLSEFQIDTADGKLGFDKLLLSPADASGRSLTLNNFRIDIPAGANNNPVAQIFESGMSFKLSVPTQTDPTVSVMQDFKVVAGPTADGAPLVTIAKATSINKIAATNAGVDESSLEILGMEFATTSVPKPQLALLLGDTSVKTISMNLNTQARLDTKAGTGSYRITADLKNMFGFDLQLNVGGISQQLIEKVAELQTMGKQPDSQKIGELVPLAMNLSLAQMNLTYKDQSLVQRLVAEAAKERGIDVDAWVAQFAASKQVLLARGAVPVLAQQWPAVEQFLRSPGTLTLSAKPAQPLPLMALVAQQQTAGAKGVMDALGLQLVATPLSVPAEKAAMSAATEAAAAAAKASAADAAPKPAEPVAK